MSCGPPISADSDGGTGGTGGASSRSTRECLVCTGGGSSRGSRECNAPSLGNRLSGCGSLACIEERGSDTAAGRQALFSDKSLKPKIQRMKGLEQEVEALMEARVHIRDRLPSSEGSTLVIPEGLEEHISETDAQPLSEWVRRLLVHEKAFDGVTARTIKEACVNVLGSATGGMLGASGRLVQLQEVKAQYENILIAVDTLLQERICALDAELRRLENEVGESADLIELCFDKMDEDGNGSITRECFIAFLCDEAAGEDAENINPVIVSPKDAGCLFDLMSRGEAELTKERFKEEITHGCLQILRDNINVRRGISKRFRDYWF